MGCHLNDENSFNFDDVKYFLICENCCWMSSTYLKTVFFSSVKQISLCPLCNNELHCFDIDTNVSKSNGVANDFTNRL